LRKTAERHLEISQYLARLRRRDIPRPDAIAATAEFFNKSQKLNITSATVLAAEPLSKSYAKDEHRIQKVDAEALGRGEVPDVTTPKGKGRVDTEADHLAALERMLRGYFI
jgi:hypothetical protein